MENSNNRYKFRAWDKRFKTMNYGAGDLLLRINEKDFSEPQQYTGLKDKNGKEIYEGDITKEEFNSGIKNCEVVFESGGFFIKNEKAEILDNLHWHSNGLVVIGNIYENPELLKQ